MIIHSDSGPDRSGAASEKTLEFDGVRVTITRSDGADGAVLVLVDTDFEPSGSDDGPGLRVMLNDDYVFTGVQYLAREDVSTCIHCGRRIVLDRGYWIDPLATGDDSIWRETCDEHDTFAAEHEPEEN